MRIRVKVDGQPFMSYDVTPSRFDKVDTEFDGPAATAVIPLEQFPYQLDLLERVEIIEGTPERRWVAYYVTADATDAMMDLELDAGRGEPTGLIGEAKL